MDTTSLRTLKAVQALHGLCRNRKEEVYFVGGGIRDFLLGKPLGKDFDFVMKGEVGEVARAMAQELAGKAFALDDTFGTWRVIWKKGSRRTDLDFSPMQGEDIREDLRQRDFTVNSIGLKVEDIFKRKNPELIDPLNGVADLQRRIIRADSEESLRRDPLRMLRAFRFSATLRFRVDPLTLEMIRKNRDLIRRSAWERIRSEFFIGLGEEKAGLFLRQLNKAGVLGEILPETRGWEDLRLRRSPEPLSLLEHAFRSVEGAQFLLGGLEKICPPFSSPLRRHFSENVEEGISRKALFKFAALLHDSGKPGAQVSRPGDEIPVFLDHDLRGEKVNTAAARRFKLSRKSVQIISDLSRNHMRLRSLSRAELSLRAKYRFFRDLGREGIDIILLSISSALGWEKSGSPFEALERNPGTGNLMSAGRELLRYYYEDFSAGTQKPLLRGTEVMEVLGLPPGKKVGVLLEKLGEAEAEGKVQTREEAVEFLKNIDNSA